MKRFRWRANLMYKKAHRSTAGNIFLGIFPVLLGFLFFFPVLFMFSNS